LERFQIQFGATMPPKTSHAPDDEPARNPVKAATGADPSRPLGRLRLLLALDALLVEGGVTAAAARLGLGAPAMSRMLAQLRALFGDPLLVRRNRTMAPTPLAERLRLRVRALAVEAETIAAGVIDDAPPLIPSPALTLAGPSPFAGAPSPAMVARRLAAVDRDSGPRARLARFIATVAAGPGGGRPLTIEEADEAMGHILDGRAEPVQIGALLAAMQQRGLTAPEMAGFGRAARARTDGRDRLIGSADLDWPAHRSPRARTAPWFALSARLVAAAGFRVVIHGGSGDSLAGLVPSSTGPAEAARRLKAGGLVHLPLPAICPALGHLAALYGSLGMRSPANAMLALLNPLAAPAIVLGAAAASYRSGEIDALALLGADRAAALLAWRDVMQAHDAPADLLTLRDGRIAVTTAPRAAPVMSLRPTGYSQAEYVDAVWTGAARDPAAERVVIATAAVALSTVSPRAVGLAEAENWATTLWRARVREAA
jgi:anthranilate phosphoribosyltransferase